MRLRQKAQTGAAARTVPDHRGHRQAVERGDLHVVGGIVAVLVKDAIDVAEHVDAAGVSVHHDPLAGAVQNFTHILEEIQHGEHRGPTGDATTDHADLGRIGREVCPPVIATASLYKIL